MKLKKKIFFLSFLAVSLCLTIGFINIQKYFMIPEKKMGSILSHLLISKNLKNISERSRKKLVSDILHQYGVSFLQFKISLKYYYSKLKKLKNIYKIVQDEIYLNQVFFNKLRPDG